MREVVSEVCVKRRWRRTFRWQAKLLEQFRVFPDVLETLEGEPWACCSRMVRTTEISATRLKLCWALAISPVGYPPLYAVLWDMVGDKDLDLSIEPNSRDTMARRCAAIGRST